MKFLEATILVILCARVLYAQEEERLDPPLICCMTYTPRKIPRKVVADYIKTSDKCPLNGVVFITTRGRQICANPSDAWVQEYINNLKEIPQGVSFPMGSRDAD
ncbi:C-C motif chemokine 3-like [Eptesicus fuscus]|uniref:C-C motif chemokine 3-like n=1 Tax=Eptesicus fuscus TaxID=29078 RepID=UPI00240402D5|nr:C-C motif chemokine 3-like [Eptesicus fuscus]